jgi:hypothetical protein
MANYKLLELRFEHPSNARLSILAREIWTGLNLLVADVQGRLLDNPALIQAKLFPYEYGKVTPDMVEEALASLAAQNWLLRYEIAGMRLIQILQWWEGNSIQYAYPSKYPAPLGWDDRTRYNRRSQKFTENWNGHRDLTPRIGEPFVPEENDKVERLPRKSRQNDKVELLPKGTESESESEIEIESESETESEEESSSSSTAKTKKDDDDPVIRKIFRAAGVRKQELKYLSITEGIQPNDCWAMLAWAFCQDTIKQPGKIMAMNILAGERASADWYDESKWTAIPLTIRKAGGLVIQGQEKQEDKYPIVATRNSSFILQDDTVTAQAKQWWLVVLEQLKVEMPKASFDAWVRGTAPVHFADGTLQVAAPTRLACDWLEQRLSSTANRLLAGIANQPIDIQFVTGEETL